MPAVGRSPSHHRYFPNRPGQAFGHRRSGLLSHSPFRPPPSPDARRSGTHSSIDVAASQPPEPWRPSSPSSRLLGWKRGGRRREEEGGKEKERLTGGPMNSALSSFLDLIQNPIFRNPYLLNRRSDTDETWT
uniref:Uncharacterized protein n=1 Tax=Oryza meridionalis TaxID=40149 RepID=A0A0E0E7W4_9ORYZ